MERRRLDLIVDDDVADLIAAAKLRVAQEQMSSSHGNAQSLANMQRIASIRLCSTWSVSESRDRRASQKQTRPSPLDTLTDRDLRQTLPGVHGPTLPAVCTRGRPITLALEVTWGLVVDLVTT